MKIGILTLFKQPLSLSNSGNSMPGYFNIVHRALLIVTVGFYSCAQPALASGPETENSIEGPRKTASSTKKIEDLPNFHKVHPYLYRGGEPTNKGLDQLSKTGIKTIIDLRAPTKTAKAEEAYAKSIGLEYINLPMSDKAPTEKQVETMLKTIDQGKKSDQPVFVHCQHGSDRTGCMIGIWRVTRDGFDYDKTYKEMRKYYFGPKYTELKDAVKKRAKS